MIYQWRVHTWLQASCLPRDGGESDRPVVSCFFLLTLSEGRSDTRFFPGSGHTSKAGGHFVDAAIPFCHIAPGPRPADPPCLSLPHRAAGCSLLSWKGGTLSWKPPQLLCGTSPPNTERFMVARIQPRSPSPQRAALGAWILHRPLRAPAKGGSCQKSLNAPKWGKDLLKQWSDNQISDKGMNKLLISILL